MERCFIQSKGVIEMSLREEINNILYRYADSLHLTNEILKLLEKVIDERIKLLKESNNDTFELEELRRFIKK